MSLVRWNPFSDVDTLFDRLAARNALSWPRFVLEGGAGKKIEWAPTADISETDKEYLIRAELPAVKKEDVQVTLHEGMLTIKGERKQHSEDKSEKYHRVESFYGSFERSFTLPNNADADKITCESKDGILAVHIPKTPASQPKAKQIAVQ